MKLTYRSWLCALLLFALVATQLPRTLAQTNEANPYAALSKGLVVHGFRTDAVYLDATDKPFGAHFIHLRTGFTLDLLQIQSVPQAVIYANTFLVSDMGEPHTQEHLLIGKGNKGRNQRASKHVADPVERVDQSNLHQLPVQYSRRSRVVLRCLR